MEWYVAFLGTPRLAPFDVGADVFGFALCDATVDGDITLFLSENIKCVV